MSIATAADLVCFALTVDGFRDVPDVVSAESVDFMTSRSSVSQSYGRGWSINPAHSNYWHAGLLPGSLSFLVRSADGWCFSGLVNGQIPGSDSSNCCGRHGTRC